MIEKIKYFKDKPILADILDLILLCVITVIIGKLLTSFIVLTGYVPSASMETRIMTEDRILADRMAYWNAEPQRGDIIVFYAPDDKALGITTYYVKRIIGLPGDIVKFKDEKVYINDIELEEPYLDSGVITRATSETDEFTVPEGHYFVMGDNRNHSVDSREWKNTFVPADDICGKVFLKYSLNFKNLHVKAVSSYNDYSF